MNTAELLPGTMVWGVVTRYTETRTIPLFGPQQPEFIQKAPVIPYPPDLPGTVTDRTTVRIGSAYFFGEGYLSEAEAVDAFKKVFALCNGRPPRDEEIIIVTKDGTFPNEEEHCTFRRDLKYPLVKAA